ncbi:hypothetical protein Hte_009848 [Hypoxylon texense]
MAAEKSQMNLEATRERPEEHGNDMSPTDSNATMVSTPAEDDSETEDVIIVGFRTIVHDPSPQPEPQSRPESGSEPKRRALPQSKPTPASASAPNPALKPRPSGVQKAPPMPRPQPPSPSWLPRVEIRPFETTAESLTLYSNARTEPANYSLARMSYGFGGRVNFRDPRHLPAVPALQVPRRPRSADGNRAGAFQQRYSGAYMPTMHM